MSSSDPAPPSPAPEPLGARLRRVARTARWIHRLAGGGWGGLRQAARWLRHTPGLWQAPRPELTEDYAAWAARFDPDPDPSKLAPLVPDSGPTISILTPCFRSDPALVRAAVESVRQQAYPFWELYLVQDGLPDPALTALLDELAASDPTRIHVLPLGAQAGIARTTQRGLDSCSGEWVTFLDHDDRLRPHTLLALERAMAPGVELVYGDEDKLSPAGERIEPHFKTDFDPDLLRAYNYICHPVAVRRERALASGGLRAAFDGAQDYDFLLRVTAGLTRGQVTHVPLVLYHWRMAPTSTAADAGVKPEAVDAGRRAVREAVASEGARVEPHPAAPAYHRVRYPLADAPRASLVIPTRDGLELLRPCVEGLLHGTDYPDLEVVVVDNGSEAPETMAYLKEREEAGDLRVVRDPSPFHFSRLVNQGAAASTGEVLVQLNNDTEVLEPGWLRELVSQALRPGVGAVGAALAYPDGTLQHGGIVLGAGGGAGHAHLGLPLGAPGYFAQAVVTREVGACRREVWDEVGGFSEDFAVAFNDVDFCLRVRAAGYRVLYAPGAALTHKESVSRGEDLAPEKKDRFRREANLLRERWTQELAVDPFYNPNLDLEWLERSHRLAWPPRVDALGWLASGERP